MIRFLCLRCSKALRADDSKAGCLARCPACRQQVTVPYVAAEELRLAEELEPDEPSSVLFVNPPRVVETLVEKVDLQDTPEGEKSAGLRAGKYLLYLLWLPILTIAGGGCGAFFGFLLLGAAVLLAALAWPPSWAFPVRESSSAGFWDWLMLGAMSFGIVFFLGLLLFGKKEGASEVGKTTHPGRIAWFLACVALVALGVTGVTLWLWFPPNRVFGAWWVMAPAVFLASLWCFGAVAYSTAVEWRDCARAKPEIPKPKSAEHSAAQAASTGPLTARQILTSKPALLLYALLGCSLFVFSIVNGSTKRGPLLYYATMSGMIGGMVIVVVALANWDANWTDPPPRENAMELARDWIPAFFLGLFAILGGVGLREIPDAKADDPTEAKVLVWLRDHLPSWALIIVGIYIIICCIKKWRDWRKYN